MFNLAGYQPIEHLYTRTRTRVPRSLPTADGRSVAIKLRQNPHPHFHPFVQLGNPYVKGNFDPLKRDLPFSARVEALPNSKQQRLTQSGARVPPQQGNRLLHYPQSDDFCCRFAHFSGRIFTAIT